MGRLTGKVALITGGAGGCGLAASQLFAKEGAAVAILDLPSSQGEALAAEINTDGGKACFFAADVSNAEQVNRAVRHAEELFGPITVLINHAGTISAGPFLETSEAEWDRLMSINVKGMYLVTKAVLPKMIEAGGGSIVCTSSISAVAGFLIDGRQMTIVARERVEGQEPDTPGRGAVWRADNGCAPGRLCAAGPLLDDGLNRRSGCAGNGQTDERYAAISYK